MKRYSIMVVEHDTGHEKELCQVDTNPSAVAQAALSMWLGRGRGRVAKYPAVRIVDNTTGKTVVK